MRSLGALGAAAFILACGNSDSPLADAGESEVETSADASSEGETNADASSEGADEASGSGETSESSESSESDTGSSCPTAQGELERQSEGEFLARELAVDANRQDCKGAWHATAGAAASTLALHLEDYAGGPAVRVRVESLLGAPLVDWSELEVGESLEFTLAQSGEVFVRLEPLDPEAPADDYRLRVSCETGCALEYTRYPTVFMHGMAGTDSYIDVVDYWWQLEEHLSTFGYAVRMPGVDAFSTYPVRAAQWKTHIDAMVEEGLGRRFNLLGHSQGGLDARYLTSILDTEARIVSVTTVASPHRGSSVADLTTGAFDAFYVDPVTINSVVQAIAGLVGLSGADLVGQVQGMSTEAMEAFNDEVLDVPGVYYSSWSGRSCSATNLICQAGNEGEVIDPLFAAPFAFMQLAEGDNDGVTGVESCKWGEWMGEVPADHMDEVGHLFDNNNGAFDHKAFYADELRRLAARGL